MRSRVFAFAVTLVTVALVASCRRAPPELERVEAGPPSPAVTPPAASSSSDTEEAADAGEADAGMKSQLHAFCAGAFAADADRMHDRCSPADYTLTQNMGRA